MTPKDLLGKVLIVEDDHIILLNLKMLLENNDYEPITATNGVEALEVLSNLEKSPDLILCDVMMPKMGGYELYQKITQNPQWNRIPFVFVTAESEPEDARLLTALGLAELDQVSWAASVCTTVQQR